jgi:hypothetical protein
VRPPGPGWRGGRNRCGEGDDRPATWRRSDGRELFAVIPSSWRRTSQRVVIQVRWVRGRGRVRSWGISATCSTPCPSVVGSRFSFVCGSSSEQRHRHTGPRRTLADHLERSPMVVNSGAPPTSTDAAVHRPGLLHLGRAVPSSIAPMATPPPVYTGEPLRAAARTLAVGWSAMPTPAGRRSSKPASTRATPSS